MTEKQLIITVLTVVTECVSDPIPAAPNAVADLVYEKLHDSGKFDEPTMLHLSDLIQAFVSGFVTADSVDSDYRYL